MGLVQADKQRALHLVGRGRVEEQDAGFLVAEARAIDPFQAPEGCADQVASVGGGDGQFDVPAGVVLRLVGLVPVGVEHDDNGRRGEALPPHLLSGAGNV